MAAAPQKVVLVIGGTGAVGQCAVAALKREGLRVIIGTRNATGEIDGCETLQIDIDDGASVAKALAPAADGKPRFDHIVSCCGAAFFKPMQQATREDFVGALGKKAAGQIDVVLTGHKVLADNGTITLTTGCLDKAFIPYGVGAATANSAVVGFVRQVSNELPRGIKVNCVSPGVLEASMPKYGPYFKGFSAVSNDDVGKGYVRAVFGGIAGKVIEVNHPSQFVEA